MRRLVLFATALTALACDPDAHRRPPTYPTPGPGGGSPGPVVVAPQPAPTPITMGDSPFYVSNGQEIWMKPLAPGGAPRRVFRADDHEGLGELSPSPDHHWIVSRISYPFDVPEARDFQTYPVLIHVDTSTRVDVQELPTRFGLSGTPKELGWVVGKLATLRITMVDGTTQEVDAPASGPPL